MEGIAATLPKIRAMIMIIRSMIGIWGIEWAIFTIVKIDLVAVSHSVIFLLILPFPTVMVKTATVVRRILVVVITSLVYPDVFVCTLF